MLLYVFSMIEETLQQDLEKERLNNIDIGIEWCSSFGYTNNTILDENAWLNLASISKTYSFLSQVYTDNNKFEKISTCILNMENIRKTITLIAPGFLTAAI